MLFFMEHHTLALPLLVCCYLFCLWIFTNDEWKSARLTCPEMNSVTTYEMQMGKIQEVISVQF